MSGQNCSFPVELGREYELKLGRSFAKWSKSVVHTLEYDFKPASVAECVDKATVSVEENNHVSVMLPSGSKGHSTTYRGPKRPCPKKCIMIVDRETGEITLERVSSTMQLKRVRTPKPALTALSTLSDKTSDKGRISPLPTHPAAPASTANKQHASPLVASSLTTPKTQTSQQQLSASSSDDSSSCSSGDSSNSEDESRPQEPQTQNGQSQVADDDNPYIKQLEADLLMSDDSGSGESSSDSDE
ncbi:ELL-associated factor 1-like [Corticium candelabrum]|uniref:ELL-associated factor 1-like n=1 Tax=Corticium candelabrum TaxID=121492 RepID=UPI002E27420F|nr:ELL-associated factor 1-like [Corticium candelabrum]